MFKYENNKKPLVYDGSHMVRDVMHKIAKCYSMQYKIAE